MGTLAAGSAPRACARARERESGGRSGRGRAPRRRFLVGIRLRSYCGARTGYDEQDASRTVSLLRRIRWPALSRSSSIAQRFFRSLASDVRRHGRRWSRHRLSCRPTSASAASSWPVEACSCAASPSGCGRKPDSRCTLPRSHSPASSSGQAAALDELEAIARSANAAKRGGRRGAGRWPYPLQR